LQILRISDRVELQYKHVERPGVLLRELKKKAAMLQKADTPLFTFGFQLEVD
jgi:hypothetical protein